MRIAAILGVAAVLAIAGTLAAQSAPAPTLPEPVVLSARPPADVGDGGFEVVPPVVDLGPTGRVDDAASEAPSQPEGGTGNPVDRTEPSETPDDVDTTPDDAVDAGGNGLDDEADDDEADDDDDEPDDDEVDDDDDDEAESDDDELDDDGTDDDD